jgi:heterodisulfide reductase subunit A
MPDSRKRILVVGGGVAGMEAAGQLVKAGYLITLVEKEKETGGHIINWFKLFPDRRNSIDVITYLDKQVDHENITVLKGKSVDRLEEKHGSFRAILSDGTDIEADSILLCTGFDIFRSERKEEYGYGIYDNVITSADLEEMFSKGKIVCTNGEVPLKIGIVHCVGSRDEKVGNLFCSKLCCVTAVKQAMEIKEFIADAKVFCFYMDMRMGGAHYEELYRESQEKYGINYIRGKVSEVSENINNKLVAKVEDTLAGRPLKMELDMLVLMPGMEMRKSAMELASSSGLALGENRYFSPADHHIGSNKSNIKGIFFAGTCTAPMNITETISHARAAVSDVMDYVNNIRD